MNWTGGTLTKFKSSKKLTKKQEERKRIEEYIRRRQGEKQLTSASGQEASTSGGPVYQRHYASPEDDSFRVLNQKFNPIEYFKRPVNPTANQWAGIDLDLLTPKVFPFSFQKISPLLLIDSTDTNNVNSAATSAEESFSIHQNSINESNNSGDMFDFGGDREDEEINEQEETREICFTPFEPNEDYGSIRPPNLSSSFMQTPSRSIQPIQSFPSPRNRSVSSLPRSAFYTPCANSDSQSISYTAKTRTPKYAEVPHIGNFDMFYMGEAMPQDEWDFNEGEDYDDNVVFGPSGVFQE